MKKIIITFLFLISSVFSFATINDNLNLLKDEEKVDGYLACTFGERERKRERGRGANKKVHTYITKLC